MTEAIEIPIEDNLDLHTFAPDETGLVLEEYFWACRRKGLLEVRVIHGKGRGVLKAGVEAFLRKSPDVESFHPAPPEQGGWGAVIVRLKPPV
ncbi:MAG: Smr/MutS family protein [Thermodesulfobacteriota bacterium]